MLRIQLKRLVLFVELCCESVSLVTQTPGSQSYSWESNIYFDSRLSCLRSQCVATIVWLELGIAAIPATVARQII